MGKRNSGHRKDYIPMLKADQEKTIVHERPGPRHPSPQRRPVEAPVQKGEMTRLGLCQSCGVEWGCSHVTVEASMVNNTQLRIFHQRFWLCKECEKDFAKKMGRGDGQAERVAWNLTH